MCFKQYLLDNNLEFEPEDLEREKQEPKVNLKVEETIEIKEIQDLDTYYSTEKVKDLKPFIIRDIRQNIVDKIKENIQKNGYYKARVLTIVKDNEEDLIIADGNHRLQALIDLNIETVPCITYPNGDLYKLSVQGNIAENTFAPLDLFDWLSIIQKLKDEGLTQKDIGEKIGWKKSYLSYHNQLLEKISTQVLDFAKTYQNGRVEEKSTNVEFNFTEGWFRDSGLYDLNEDYQMDCLERFVKEKKHWSKEKLQKETKKYKQWQEFIEIAKEELNNQDNLDEIIELIENNNFKTDKQLRDKIADLNKESKNKLICGDAIQELEKLEDALIDIIITDLPYGIEYKSNRSQFNEHITKDGVQNDNLKEVLELLNSSCEILNRKTKSNAHFYFFTSWKVYPEFKEIIEKYLEIKNVIIWDKCNHGAGDLEYNWGDRHEFIIFAIKGKRPLTKRKANIISIPKISPDKLIHSVQKPVALIKELLEASAQSADTICDPFMGSGSTIKAVKEIGKMNYIGIELDKEIFEKAKTFIGV